MPSHRTFLHLSMLATLTVCGSLVGCMAHAPTGHPSKPLAESDYPGALVESTALPDGIFFRQHIEAHFGEHNMEFSAVLQSDAGVLRMLALTPYGSRAFLLEQRGEKVSLTRYVDSALPFPARFILLDVHRTFFIGISASPLGDGTHTSSIAGEDITELWNGGRLQERRFRRQDARPAGEIRIVYGGGMLGAVPPARIDLYNGWFHYHLVIHTLPPE